MNMTAEFFQRDPVTCAREMIGCELVWNGCGGVIVETEAYSVRTVSAKKSITVFRVTLQTGTILIFTGYVAGGRGLDGSVGALATGQISVKLAAPEQYFAS